MLHCVLTMENRDSIDQARVSTAFFVGFETKSELLKSFVLSV
jgi:hypothetical protein